MDDHFQALKGAFEALKHQLPALQARLADASERLQAGELAEPDRVDELRELLAEYAKLSGDLRRAAERLSIGIPPKLGELEDQLLELEAQRSARRLRETVHTYFRLTARDEALRESLEATKQALREKCVEPPEELADALRPYSAVARRAQSPNDFLSEDEFDLIYSQIGRKIALAAERGQLILDARADIQPYLEGAGAWLRQEEDAAEPTAGETPAQAEPAPGEEAQERPAGADAEASEESPSAAGPAQAIEAGQGQTEAAEIEQSETVEAEQGQPGETEAEEAGGGELPVAGDDDAPASKTGGPDGAEDPGDKGNSDGADDPEGEDGSSGEENAPLWDEFDGYLCEGASFSLGEDTPAGQLSSKIFERHMNKTRGDIAGAISCVANEKLCSDEGIDEDEDFRTVPPELIEFMTRQGYFRRVTFTDGEFRKDYWTLSSKGWACFTKRQVAEIVRDYRLLPVPEKKHPAEAWSALDMARYAELYRYMVAARSPYATDSANGVLFAIFRRDKGTLYVPAVFARGKEDIGALCDFLRSRPNAKRFALIVRSAADARKLEDLLAWADEGISEGAIEGERLPLDRIRYVRIDEPGKLFRLKKVPDDTEGSAPGQSPREETPPAGETDSPVEELTEEVTDQPVEEPAVEETDQLIEEPAAQEADPSVEEAAAETASAPVAEVDTELARAPIEETIETGEAEARPTSGPGAAKPEQGAAPAGEAAKIQQYLDGAWRMQLAGRTDVAAAMLKSLVLRDPQLRMLAEQFACATGDPSIEGNSNSNALQAVFSLPAGSDAVMDTFAAAAYLRMYFSSAASEQTYLSRDISHQRENLALKRYPDLKDVLFSLADWVKYQQRGLDAELIELLLQNNDAGERQRELQKRAQDFLSRRLTESSHGDKRIKLNRENLFGSKSEIYRLLVAIRDGDLSLKPLAEEFAWRDADSIIDDGWSEAARQFKFSRNDNCTGAERATLTRQIKSISQLARDWLTVNTAKSHISNDQTQDAVGRIAQLRPLMQSALEKLSSGDEALPLAQRAAESVLAGAVRDCLDRITGRSTQQRQAHDYYINLLKEPLIALAELNQPLIEAPDEEVEPFDFCRRAMKYLDAPPRAWDEVLRRLFTGTGPDHSGMDYGCASVLKYYLTLTGQEELWKSEYSIENAVSDALDKTSVKRNSVSMWEQDFTARLEMADGDNWFDADQELRAHIQKVLLKQKELYYYSENFGFYGRAMNRLLELLRGKAQGLRPRYRAEYQALTERLSEENQALPIFTQIQEMIERDRFGAAESFMQQVRNGNLTIGNGELSSGVLDDFLNRVDRELFQLARLDNHKPLAAAFQSMHRQLTNANQLSGEAMLKAWPNGVLQPEKLKIFFTELDQQVQSVNGQGSEFLVMLKDRGILKDYPHPIAAFGSIMDQQGIDIALINGSRDAEGLLTEIEKLLRKDHTNRPMLVFVNSALTVPDRRRLAKSVSRITSSKPFLLLDRCLALYLADVPKTDRWKTLLRCSLPFRVLNPYFENSSMPIPPDMFIGRRKEIQDIIAPGGPNLLYGGRQLGKTAILRRVELQQNCPAEGNWAVYVDIRDMNGAEAVETIAKALFRKDFLPSIERVSNWKELLRAIEHHLLDDPASANHTLLLMLDEADNTLNLFEEDCFHTLDDMKRLQQDTNGRFKFVLAGLHNVLRLSKSALAANNMLPQLSGITIQPMKFSDGRELLEVPLSYLGFTIDRGQEDIIAQILHNTNYFPGLIHFYASRLVEHMKETSSEMTTPPYRLSRDTLLRMIGDESFRKQRTDKLMMTLRVDERDQDAYYYTLANALAMCSYQSEDVLLHGARAADIRAYCTDMSPDCRLGKLTNQQVEALLDELAILNILRQEMRNGVAFYKFSRSSFLEMLGNENEVFENLFNTLDKESGEA